MGIFTKKKEENSPRYLSVYKKILYICTNNTKLKPQTNQYNN